MLTVAAKTIVTKTRGTGWFGSEYNMNIYRGCCHGCIYCDSRSDCYRIEDFDTVRAKENALQIIRDDLRRKVKTGVVSTGAMSDPYNPFEREEKLTRHALELLNAYDFGVAIATKSDLITRDIDILTEIKAHSPVICKITVTTCDEILAKKLEPFAPSPKRRLEAIKKLSDAGIFTGILMMPQIPFLEGTKENIRDIVLAAAESGVRFIYPAIGMTMRTGQREYFYKKLDEAFPDMGLSERFKKRYGGNYECRCENAAELYKYFGSLCSENGIIYDMKDIIRSSQLGYSQQMSLF